MDARDDAGDDERRRRSIWATPAAMVTTLNGIGVMPLMMIASTP